MDDLFFYLCEFLQHRSKQELRTVLYRSNPHLVEVDQRF